MKVIQKEKRKKHIEKVMLLIKTNKILRTGSQKLRPSTKTWLSLFIRGGGCTKKKTRNKEGNKEPKRKGHT